MNENTAISSIDDPSKVGAKKRSKKLVPNTLTGFLRSDCSAQDYVNALVGRAADTIDDDERDRALDLIKLDPALLRRAAELARASLNGSQTSRIKQTISSFSTAIIRAEGGDLAEWSRLAGSTAEAELAKLAKHLQGSRKSGDKNDLQRAEQVFMLGFEVVRARGDFNLIGTLAVIHSILVSGEDSGSHKMIMRALGRASVKNLETYSAINAVVSASLANSEMQLARASEQLRDLQLRVRDQREMMENQRSDLETLRLENQQLAEALAESRAHMSGIAGGRDADLNALRARSRKLLSGELGELVSQAHEALTSTPPAPEIAEVLLDDARKAISKELEWLKQFLG